MPRPRRSESFYIKLSPQMSQVISLATKASISRPSPTACNTSFPTLPSPVKTSVAELRIAVEDTTVDTDDEAEESEEPKVRRSLTPPSFRPSFEQLCSAVPCSAAANPYAKYQPKRPSPLRRITNKPLCGSALFSSQSAMLPLFTRLEADNTVPDRLYPRSHPRTPLFKQAIRRAFFAGPCGPSAKKFGVRGAWEVERDIQRAIEGGYCGLVNDFELQVSPTRASFKPKLRLLTKCDNDSESSSSDEEDEEGSSGSDGSEEYGPSGFFESSSSEEDEDGDITDVSWEDISH